MTQHHQLDDDAAGGQRDTILVTLPLSDLALFSAHELQVLIEGGTPNDRYPLELFRRAVVLRDSAAWGCIYRQYAPFVLPWLQRHVQAESLLAEAEPAALVDAVLSTLAINLSEEKLARLTSLADILRYLRMCIHSTLSDWRRDQQLLERLALAAGETAPGQPTLAHAARGEDLAQGLWQVLLEELADEEQRLLFTLLFVRGYSARAVCLHEAARFPDLETVSRLKLQMYERLRASERVQAILHAPD
jgi:predicted secreted protein